MLTFGSGIRRAAATTVIAAIVALTVLLPGWCLTTGLWW
jgi:hypothetical protein